MPLPAKEAVQVWSSASIPAQAKRKGRGGLECGTHFCFFAVYRPDLSPRAAMISQCQTPALPHGQLINDTAL